MEFYQSQLPYWLALHFIPHLTTKRCQLLRGFFKDLRELFALSLSDLTGIGLPQACAEGIHQPPWSRVEAQLQWAAQQNHHLLTVDHPHYPTALMQIADPPLVLWAKGNTQLLQELRQIGIVGSRHPTPHGERNAYQFANYLAKMGWVITSGLALGIDGIAHQAALDATAATVAVLGASIEHIYPTAHQALARTMADKALLISEFCIDTTPRRQHFPRRNRIISGLCQGVLVVEAAIGSGSLITAKHALEQNREVFAIPGSIHNPLARGCHQLIKEGAKLVETAADILEELTGFLAPPPMEREPTGLDNKYTSVLQCIDFAPTSIDSVIERLGLTPQAVSSMLLILQVQGYIATEGGMYFRIK